VALGKDPDPDAHATRGVTFLTITQTVRWNGPAPLFLRRSIRGLSFATRLVSRLPTIVISVVANG
jgi:hypothetical protein